MWRLVYQNQKETLYFSLSSSKEHDTDVFIGFNIEMNEESLKREHYHKEARERRMERALTSWWGSHVVRRPSLDSFMLGFMPASLEASLTFAYFISFRSLPLVNSLSCLSPNYPSLFDGFVLHDNRSRSLFKHAISCQESLEEEDQREKENFYLNHEWGSRSRVSLNSLGSVWLHHRHHSHQKQQTRVTLFLDSFRNPRLDKKTLERLVWFRWVCSRFLRD